MRRCHVSAEDRGKGSWGYGEADHVGMKIPTELVQAVGEFVADPDAFVAAIAASASGPKLVKVGEHSWLDPGEIVMMCENLEVYGWTMIYLRGGHTAEVKGSVAEITERLVGPSE